MGTRGIVMFMVAAVLGLTAGACTAKPSTTTTPSGGGPATGWSVNPKTVDPASSNDPIFTSLAYAPTVPAIGKLAVVLHGTGGSPQNHQEIANTLRSAGFHVIVLRYSATVGTESACPDTNAATDPDCHRTFRSETVFGAGVPDPLGVARDHPLTNITQANSVMNRLLKLVQYLQDLSPASGWGSFQQRTGGVCTSVNTTYGACDLDWPNVVAIGHSQGAGVALYLGKFFPLGKVAMLSGSYDAYDVGGTFQAAPWVAEGGLAVANADIGTLEHTSDFGLPYFRTVEDAALVAGPETSVSSSAPPYGGSHRLITSLTPTCPLLSVPNHNSTAVDACTPDGAYVAAWRYLAGA